MAFPKLHKNIKVRLITFFLSTMLAWMIYPFMAIYFSNYFGAKLTGFLLTGSVAMGVFVGLYGGYLADKLGRKNILLIGVGISLVLFLVMAVANSPLFHSVPVTLVAFLLLGISGGLVGPATGALVIDSTNEENRPFVFSIQHWVENLAVMIGATIGGFYFQNHKFAIFSGIAIVAVIEMILTVFFIQEVYQPKVVIEKIHVLKGIAKSYKQAVKNKAFMFMLIGTTLLYSSEKHLPNFIGVHWAERFKEFTLSLFGKIQMNVTGYKLVGFFTTEMTILVVAFGIFIAAWLKGKNTKSKKNILFIASGIYMFSFAILATVTSLPAILFLGVIITFGEILTVPIVGAFSAEMMDEENRGSYSALKNVGSNMRQLLGTLGLSLYGLIGTLGMTIVMTVILIVTLILFQKSLRIHFSQKEIDYEEISRKKLGLLDK